jgi:hypothetical protein
VNFKKRLKALENKVANEGIILTDAQVAALVKKKHDDETCSEIETAPQVIKIDFTSVTSKALGVSTNNPSLINTAKWGSLSSTPRKCQLLRLTTQRQSTAVLRTVRASNVTYSDQ